MKIFLQIALACAVAFVIVQAPEQADRSVQIKKIEPIHTKPVVPATAPTKDIAKDQIAKPSKQPINAVATGKTAIMDAANIPLPDRYYVDCVINGCEGVSAEGGWNGATRWNTAGSGAYGICQALPASKMASAGEDWRTNPVTQLKWCDSYAKQYGSWKQAWEFRKCLGKCYSNRTKSYVHKDHTWW